VIIGLPAIIATLALVVAQTGGDASQETGISGSLHPPEQVWAGEVFDLELDWTVPWEAFRNVEDEPELAGSGIMTGPWSGARTVPPGAGEAAGHVAFTASAMAREAGDMTAGPASQVFIMQRLEGEPGRSARMVAAPVRALSEPAALAVRPLPEGPPGFTGAVGRFDLRSWLDTDVVPAGEPVRWTVRLDGRGSWPLIDGLPPRGLPPGIRAEASVTVEEFPGVDMFENGLEETVILVPGEPGRYELGPVRVAVFDPRRGAYDVLVAPSVVLEVTAPGSGAEPPAARTAQARSALPPLPRAVIGFWTAGPLLAAALLWLGLAGWRTWTGDENRHARSAQRRLGAALRALGRARDIRSRDRALRLWQSAAAARWGERSAAPTADAMGGRPDWTRLWQEADDALYGADRSLAPDWSARAREAVRTAPPAAGFPWREVAAQRNAAPWARAAIALCVLAAAWPGSQAVAAASGTALAERIEAVPLDWAARREFAETLAAEGRDREAAAHALIAWIHNPASRDGRELLQRVGAGRAGDGLGGIHVGALGGLLSPGAWQRAVCAAGLIAGLGGVLALLWGYGLAGGRTGRMGAALLALAIMGASYGLWTLHGYGAAGDRRAAVTWGETQVRELPIEMPYEVAVQEIPAGTILKTGARFLGWREITGPGPWSGWVREGDIIHIWGDHDPDDGANEAGEALE
jgi:hypothetical protein